MNAKSKTPSKKPLSRRFGSFVTKATMGLGYKTGRGAYRIGKNVVAGATDAGREIVRGYEEAKAEQK